jgi:hypothetical protein
MEGDRARAGGPRSRGPRVVNVGRGRSITLLQPPESALEYGLDVARRVHDRPAPVRNGFIERWRPSDPPPPLAAMLGGGQGGSVRLKLLLSLIWFSVKAPHNTDYPARAWAALLGLDEPETNGARRVNAAIAWLEKNNYLRVKPRPGMPAEVFLLDERGDGRPYTIPAEALKAKSDGERPTRDDYWVPLPPEFWTKGWISVLRAAAVAMLLVLLDDAKARKDSDGIWHSPSRAADRFALSQDTRTDGLLELEAYNIVDKRRTPISPGVFDYRRMRNVYDLHVEQLTAMPGELRPKKRVDVDQLDPELAEIGDLHELAESSESLH